MDLQQVAGSGLLGTSSHTPLSVLQNEVWQAGYEAKQGVEHSIAKNNKTEN